MATGFPSANDLVLQPILDELEKMFITTQKAKEVIDSHREPTKDDLENWIAQSKDDGVKLLLEDIEYFEEEIAATYSKLTDLATEALQSSANGDERKAARSSYNAHKNKLVMGLHAFANIAAREGRHDLVMWVDKALAEVPKPLTARDNDSKAMREWLQENHPEANIKSRGTIPLKWKSVYYNHAEV